MKNKMDTPLTAAVPPLVWTEPAGGNWDWIGHLEGEEDMPLFMIECGRRLVGAFLPTDAEGEYATSKQCRSVAEMAWEAWYRKHFQGAEFAALGLLADIRAAAGDPEGRLMQDELVERIRSRSELLGIVRWFVNGERGLSSTALAAVACGIAPNDAYHPCDPADLNRCLQLLARVPEVRNSLPEVAKLSPEWAALVDHWDEIEALFLEEAGLGWTLSRRAPRTYERMRDVMTDARRKEKEARK